MAPERAMKPGHGPRSAICVLALCAVAAGYHHNNVELLNQLLNVSRDGPEMELLAASNSIDEEGQESLISGCAGGVGKLDDLPPADCTLSSSLVRLKEEIVKYNATTHSTSMPGTVRQGDINDDLVNAAVQVSSASVRTLNWEPFVVTLRRRSQRLEGFRKALKEQEPWISEKLSPVWAVDGRKLAKDKAAKSSLVGSGFMEVDTAVSAMEEPLAYLWWDLSPGAIGCYLSHAMAWSKVVEKGLDYGLIFEDDTRYFSKGFQDGVKAVVGAPGVAGDIVYLQHCDSSADWPRGSDQVPAQPSKLHVLDSDLIVPCTAAYMISQKAARQLLAQAFPVRTQLDRALAGQAVENLTRMRFEPALAQVGRESAESDIQDNSAGISWLVKYISFKAKELLKGAMGSSADTVDNVSAPENVTLAARNSSSSATMLRRNTLVPKGVNVSLITSELGAQ